LYSVNLPEHNPVLSGDLERVFETVAPVPAAKGTQGTISL